MHLPGRMWKRFPRPSRSDVLRGEDDLARGPARLGVAQRGGGIGQVKTPRDLRRDRTPFEQLEDLAEIVAQLGAVARRPEPAAGPQVEEGRAPSVRRKV